MKTRPLAILVSWAMLSAQLSNTAWAPSLSAEEPKGTVTTSLSPPPTPRSRVTLRDVQVQEDTVTIRASAPVKYQTFWLSEPRRLVIDLLNTELDWQKKALTVKGPLIQRVRSGQFQDKPLKIARVVVELNQPAEYTAESKDGQITVTLQSKTVKAPVKPASPTVEASPSVVTASSLAVTAVASSTAPATPLVQTPPLTVSASTPTTPAPLPVKEAPAQPTEAKKSVTLPTSPVTLDFVDADVRDVLQVLSVKSGINIVYGSDVTGTVTVHLENVPFDQAFQTVLTLRGLVAAPAGDNILRVITSAALTTERSQAVTFTKVFSLRYAKGTDLKTQLDAIRGAEGRKGTITLDPATSSLVVTDTPEGLQQAERHIRELDRPPSQVSIEAKIIEVALGKSLDLGVDWGYARTTSRQGNTITVGGSDVVPPTGPGAGINTPGGPTGRIALPGGGSSGLGLLQGAGVATSGQTPAGGVFSFGVLGASSQLDVVLKALAKKSNTKILSNPRIITLNNQEAKILVGDRIPYTITNVSPGQGQTQSTQFVEVGVKLAVTPTINVDKRITLKIRPEVSQAKTITPGQAPQVSTREAETVIMIRNGETVVIGGLIKEQTDKTASQVPLLGDIPVIGQLFKTSSNSKTRTELLVFVTPTVVEE